MSSRIAGSSHSHWLVGPVVGALLFLSPHVHAEPMPGTVAPEFSLPDLNGQTVTLGDLRGKMVVVEWFNPGCPFVKYAHNGDHVLATMAASQPEEVRWFGWPSIPAHRASRVMDRS
ncbi:MAG: redoxin domain-containing protein [Proteobacteria bacterium]|nr:redoxin domain-containing protein [Pseudomonadota bacterium]